MELQSKQAGHFGAVKHSPDPRTCLIAAMQVNGRCRSLVWAALVFTSLLAGRILATRLIAALYGVGLLQLMRSATAKPCCLCETSQSGSCGRLC